MTDPEPMVASDAVAAVLTEAEREFLAVTYYDGAPSRDEMQASLEACVASILTDRLAAERAKTAALVEAVWAVIESPDDEQEWERVEGEVTAVQVVDVARLRAVLAEHGAQEQAGGGE